MKDESTKAKDASRICWGELELWLRGQLQGLVQGLLEEEVTELIGRCRHERRNGIDENPAYRNGHGKPRHLTLSSGTITVRRPRVRNMEERFESRILPLFVRRTSQVADLLPELYLHGLSLGDFDLALRGLLGEKAPLSASTVARLKEKWQAEHAEWSRRSLQGLEVVYLWVDGVYLKAGLEKQKAALLVAVAGLADGRKVLVALEAGHRESEECWSALLRDLRDRGMTMPRLVLGDGHLGIWAGLRNVFPEAEEQRCWNHRIVNILAKVPKRSQAQARMMLRAIPYAETVEEAARLKGVFQKWCRGLALHAAAELIDHDWDRMVTFYRFPKDHWRHLRTSNAIESPFAALRLRTDAAKRFKKVENATAVVYKMLLVAEKRFRKLNAPELLKEVFLGVTFHNGVPVNRQQTEAAA
jgi:transposase-like protein